MYHNHYPPHRHNHCPMGGDHDKRYCSDCGVYFCEKCGKEFNQRTIWLRAPYSPWGDSIYLCKH